MEGKDREKELNRKRESRKESVASAFVPSHCVLLFILRPYGWTDQPFSSVQVRE